MEEYRKPPQRGFPEAALVVSQRILYDDIPHRYFEVRKRSKQLQNRGA